MSVASGRDLECRLLAPSDPNQLSLTEHAVRARTPDLFRVSGPDDFGLEAGRAVAASRMSDPDVSPYCFDFANRSLLCVSTADIAGAPFFYQAQRQQAKSVIKVPFASLPDGPASPALMFSIGRCGSTLLVKVLEAAGVRVVSEPDFYTQVAIQAPTDLSLRRPIAGATKLLTYSVFKLRLECNNAPLLIAGAFASPRILFILRNPVDWAASLRRLSRNALDPNWCVATLARGLGALEELTRNYAVQVCYYEDFRDLGRERVAELLSWAGSPAALSRETLQAIGGKDAQEGTIVSRASVRNVPDDPGFREAFGREWSRRRPAELIARLGLRSL